MLSTKAGEASMQAIMYFLNGDAVLEMSGDLDIPPDLAMFDDDKKPPTMSPVADPEVDGETVNDDENDEVT